MRGLLVNALAGTVLILAAALARRALGGRLPPEVWLTLWAVCLLRLFAPAVPESALSVYGLPRLLAENIAPPAGDPAPGPDPGAAEGTALPAPTPLPAPADGGGSVDWGAVLGAVWLLGSAATAVRLGLSWRRTRRAVRGCAAVPAGDPRYAALPQGTRLREGPMAGAPLTFGVLRPTVVLPPGLSGDALGFVLAHEGVHARRRDNLWHYAAALAQTVFWWDPAVWLLAGLLRRDIELSCDRSVVRRLGPDRRREYALTLLELSTQAGGAGFCRTFGRKPAEERILAIMNYKKMSVRLIALSVALVCLVTAAFATQPLPEPVEEPAPAISEEMLEAFKARVVEMVRESLQKQLQESLTTGAQADCSHRNTSIAKAYMYRSESDTSHTKVVMTIVVCDDCGKELSGTEKRSSVDHAFGSPSYAGADHSSSNFREHYYIYTHMCTLCDKVVTCTRPAACTKNGCVEIASVGEVDS